MSIKIKQLLIDADSDETKIYTILTEDNRIFVGGIHQNKFMWQELPPPTEKNTHWIGDNLNSPFRPKENDHE